MDAILADHALQQSGPKRPKKAQEDLGGNIEFKRKREPRIAGELNDIERRQLVVCGRCWDGNEWSAERRLRPAKESEEGCFADGSLEVWEVWVDGEHTLDAWMYKVDSGTVFRRGTTRVEGQRIQFTFSAADPLLARRLQAAYDAATG